MVSCEYLGSMLEVDDIDQYAIDEHILCEIMKEVDVLKAKMAKRRQLDCSKIQWVGQCLPMLAVYYLFPFCCNLFIVPYFCFILVVAVII